MDKERSDARNSKRPASLVHQVMDDLSRKIEQREYAPGDKLPPESGLMCEQGVSRTVIREAISRLQAAGLVETRHGIGTFVLTPPILRPRLDFSTVATIDNVLAMLEFRICMDTEAAGLAALRRNEAQLGAMREALEDMETGLSQGNPSIEADFRFHFLIAQATNNPVFEDFYQYFGTTMIPRTRLDTAYYLPGRGPQFLLSVNREHKRILDGIARQDQKAARNAMYKHLYNSRERLQQVSKANEAKKPLLRGVFR